MEKNRLICGEGIPTTNPPPWDAQLRPKVGAPASPSHEPNLRVFRMGIFSWRFFCVFFHMYDVQCNASNLDIVQYVYINIYIHKTFDSEQSYLSIQLTILKTKQPGKNNLGLKFKFLKTCCKTYNVSVTIHPPNPQISDPGVWNQVTNPSFHSSEWLMGHPKKKLIKGYNLNYYILRIISYSITKL